MSDNAVSVPEHGPDMMALLHAAIDKKVDVATLERLVALHERAADRTAATEFALAMSAFQNECPPIVKRSEAEVVTKSGSRYRYRYAELDEIARTVNPLLAKHGLSYTWDSEVQNNDWVKCTCKLSHVGGHATTATFTAPVDTAARMSGPQKYAAALTYSKRQSLVQVLGLTQADPDTDAAPIRSAEPVTESQAADLELMAENVGADKAKFLAFLGAASFDEIRADDYGRAVAALKAKERQK